MLETISAEKVVQSLASHTAPALLDVRSEGEYAEAHVRGFANGPILNNIERHQVGLSYRNEGREAAIKLGHSLFNPEKSARVAAWLKHAGEREVWVACWRGGLRSKIACELLAEAGANPVQIVGGYKAIRAELTRVFSAPPPLTVLSGLTGCGKTDLIEMLPHCAVDLEGIAHHRGSAFGGHIGSAQPNQSQFENDLGLSLHQHSQAALLEDESAQIGNLSLSREFKERMNQSPTILLEATLEDRVRRVFRAYIEEPLSKGVTIEAIQNSFAAALLRIRPRLGGMVYDEISKSLTDAFLALPERPSETRHADWIGALLTQYYDRLYRYSLERKPRSFVFKGNFQECLAWINQNLPQASASPKPLKREAAPLSSQPANSGPF